MTELGGQAIVLVVMLLIVLGPAMTAAWFLNRRRRLERLRRRSPLAGELLRGPGHALREQLESIRLDVGFDLAILTFIPAFPLAFFYLQLLFLGKKLPLVVLGLVFVAVVGFVAYQIRTMLKRSEEMDNLRLGLDAEVAVGEELSQLMRHGASVFHDFPAENFNIDHVVIAQQGVFAVETKGYSKAIRGLGKADATVIYDGTVLKFPTWATKEPIEQAERQAAWLSKWLTSATGSPVRALPVIALPGWFVERTGRGGVRVFNGRELAGLLKARGAQPLSQQDVQRIAHQVEQRCRSVTPRYTEVGRET